MSNDVQLACVALALYFVTIDYIACRSRNIHPQYSNNYLRVALLLMLLALVFPTMIILPWLYEFTLKPTP